MQFEGFYSSHRLTLQTSVLEVPGLNDGRDTRVSWQSVSWFSSANL